MPNSGGTGAGNLTNNYSREEQRTTDRDNYDVKINFNRTATHQVWGKFSMLDAVVDDLTYYLGPETNSDQDGGFTKVYMGTIGQTWTLGSTVVWDATFGFSRQDQKAFGADFFTGNFGLDVLGIPGTNDQGTGNPRYAGYPQFATGFSTLGNLDTWTPVWRDERVTSVATNVTKIKGRHDLRAGYSMNFLFLNHWQPEVDNPRGRFEFSGNTTALRGTGAQTGNFYNQYASFLLGLVSNARKSVQHELLTGREWQHGLFIRDRWQATARLTLDLGLRWEYYPIMHRMDRGIERVDLDTLDVLLGGRGGNPDRPRAHGGEGQLRAARRGDLPPEREQRVSLGIRRDLQSAAVVASDARSVSAHHRGELPAERTVQLLLDARSGHPADHRTRSEQRPVPTPGVGGHAHAQAG